VGYQNLGQNKTMRLAELVCHNCGSTGYSTLPTYPMGTMPPCANCGGHTQVVRVVDEGQLSGEKPDAQRRDEVA
jgi:hypothetical protein